MTHSTKAGTALEKVVSTVDTTGCTENGGNADTCSALEKAVADAKAGLAEKPGKDVAKLKEATAKREKLTESLTALSKTLATQQANATVSYLDKECPASLDPECGTLRGAGLKLTEAKAKVEAIKARVAAAAAAVSTPEAPAGDSGAGTEVSEDTGYSGGGEDGYGHSEPAYEAPEPEPEPAYEAPAAPEPEVESNSGGGRWVDSGWQKDGIPYCGVGDEFGNFEYVPCP
ncbi:hypothetical protein ACRQEF_03235 [Actinotignum sp. GS-2025a]|uniref:hypothetical protein n=1 Tax=Actinotignum sp. GS-2025a TaxID=3427274 RepID=UPI003F4544E6